MLPYFYSPCVKGGTRNTIIIVVRGLAGDWLSVFDVHTTVI